MTRCGRAATTSHERRIPPETGALMDPPPRDGIPRMITAASTNVAASAMNKTFVDLGTMERILEPTECACHENGRNGLDDERESDIPCVVCREVDCYQGGDLGQWVPK